MPDLYAYQQEDVQRLDAILRDQGAVLLLNEQRTGKLIEFIELCRRRWLARPSLRRVLIVAPLSTLWNVQAEFARWLGWSVTVNAPAPANGLEQPQVTVINIEKLRNPHSWLLNSVWDLVLLDEAHHYRGRRSQQTRGAFRLQADALVVSTGTPLMNGRPAELWPLLHLAAPKEWSSFWAFLDEYAVHLPSLVGAWQDERSPWRQRARLRLQEWLAPRSLRRTFRECRPDMPPELPAQTVPLVLAELDPVHFAAYRRFEREWQVTLAGQHVAAPTALALTTRLRQLAASPCVLAPGADPGGKMHAIAEYLAGWVGKVLVFCWHRAVVDAVAQALGAPWCVLTVTGDHTPTQRAARCRTFQMATLAERVALIATIGAVGEGLALDAADLVVFAEKSWVPDENDQAAARALGPERTTWPQVVSFVCTDTIEADIERVLARKSRDTDAFLALRDAALARLGGAA